MAPEGLSRGRDSRGKRRSGGGIFILAQARIRGITVQSNTTSAPPGRSAMKLSVEKTGLLRQVRHDAQPSKEGLFSRIEARGGKALPESLFLEIDSSESERARFRDRRLGKPLAFPGLGGRVVNFKDA